MAKKHGLNIPKKYFPGLERVTRISDGKRVWLYKGKEFDTKKEVMEYDVQRLLKKAKKEKED